MNNETNYDFMVELADMHGLEHTRLIEISATNLEEAVEGMEWKVRNDYEGMEFVKAFVSTAKSGWHKLSLVVV